MAACFEAIVAQHERHLHEQGHQCRMKREDSVVEAQEVAVGLQHGRAAAPQQAPVVVYFDGKDHRTKTKIEDLVCEHSLIYSRQAIGFTDLAPEELAAFRPVTAGSG